MIVYDDSTTLRFPPQPTGGQSPIIKSLFICGLKFHVANRGRANTLMRCQKGGRSRSCLELIVGARDTGAPVSIPREMLLRHETR